MCTIPFLLVVSYNSFYGIKGGCINEIAVACVILKSGPSAHLSCFLPAQRTIYDPQHTMSFNAWKTHIEEGDTVVIHIVRIETVTCTRSVSDLLHWGGSLSSLETICRLSLSRKARSLQVVMVASSMIRWLEKNMVPRYVKGNNSA